MRNKVPGSRFAVSDNGWIDHELFSSFLTEHFMVNAVPHRPLLLLLDGHSTHFEPKSLQMAKDNNIIIFCLPPHRRILHTYANPWIAVCLSHSRSNSSGGKNVTASTKKILDW